jgi:hypothetical protein
MTSAADSSREPLKSKVRNPRVRVRWFVDCGRENWKVEIKKSWFTWEIVCTTTDKSLAISRAEMLSESDNSDPTVIAEFK